MRESSDIVQRTGDQEQIPTLAALAAQRDLLYGRADAAVRHLEPIFPTSDTEHEVPLLLAEAYIASGNHTRAMQLIRVRSELARLQNNRLVLPGWLRLEAMLLLSHGQWEEADEALQTALSLASTLPYPYEAAQILFVRGRLRAEQGRSGEARGFMEEALTKFQRLGAQPFAQRVDQDLDALPPGRAQSQRQSGSGRA